MDEPNRSVALAAVETAVSTALAAVVHAAESSTDESTQRAVKRRRLSLFPLEMDDAKFRATFGMRRNSFDWICAFLGHQWLQTHRPIGANSRFQLRDRVAIAVFYLTHCTTLEEAAETFDTTSKAAGRYLWQVMTVLLSDNVKTQYFNFPTSEEHWSQLSDEFQAICGYPNCCLAVGGMLVEIERPRHWEGWYCGRHFPAENVQLVVDAQCRVRSMDVRPGGITDRETLRYSRFGRNLAEIVPEGKHIVGHAGYPLSKHVVVPYPVTTDMSAAEMLFNSLQSTTQRAVKRTGEMIKKRFRILQSPLRQRTEDGDAATTQMAQIISTAIVLHNVLVDLNDLVEVDSSLEDDTDEEDMDEDSDTEDSDMDESMEDDAAAQRDRIKEFLYVNRDHIVNQFG
ncbi:hypothetical protein PRIC1_007742 [Phytophthora ramorum]|uniref:DDE Tnp4 domain-containing protein n=1 Tax=Phytophthora ramorum TaxID=164328 RepID=H3GTF3_PHYRM|nr:Protein ALP1-like [Phytophthora ramorum]KAH7502584.1 Protein ALP1-like [Phytophthora ramorum]